MKYREILDNYCKERYYFNVSKIDDDRIRQATEETFNFKIHLLEVRIKETKEEILEELKKSVIFRWLIK